MAYMPDKENERAQEVIRRYNLPIPLEDLLAYVSSVYAEGRSDERRECIKCVNEVQLNALKAQRLEAGKSQSGMDFQSGRRKGAEDAITQIEARAALQITQDSLANSYPEAEEAQAAEVAAQPVAVEPEPEIEPVIHPETDEIDAEIIDAMQINVPDVADEVEQAEIEDDDEDEVEERPIRKRRAPVSRTVAKKKAKRTSSRK